MSSRKLLNAGYKDFTRKYRIENITQERYNALQPYILGRLSDDINNFIVITPSAGIPPKVLGELRLSAKELLDAKKDLTLTIAEEKEILNNTVNLSNLSSGLYFMSIKVENGSQSFKIIKE